MLRNLGILGTAIAVVLTASACVSPEAHRRVIAANEALRRQFDDLEGYHRTLQGEHQSLQAELERLASTAVDADYLRQRKKELEGLIEQFRDGGLRQIQGVTVRQTAEGVAFQLQGEVLFASGQTEVTSSGKDVLAQIVPVLREHGKEVRIDGHTDSDPIRRSRWKTNLRLSSERAMAVYDYLSGQGIDAASMHVAAFGAHRPAQPGSDDGAKRQNRRVEIMMLGGRLGG